MQNEAEAGIRKLPDINAFCMNSEVKDTIINFN